MIRALLFILLLTIFAMAEAQSNITVKGLFKNTVVLLVDGEQVLIKKGQTKQGIRLIESDSKSAIIEVAGERQTVTLSSQVGGSYRAPEKRVVRIASQRGGHHWVTGQINGRNVSFVVDTGASVISMNLSTAKRLGVDYQNGSTAWASTANGVKEVRSVLLDSVTIGSITKNQVAASVHLDDSLPVVLLGNSFLRQVDMRIEAGVMILESR